MRNLKSKKLKECEGEELYLNLENMDVYCNFPFPDDGVTFRTKILEIILDGDIVNPEDSLNDEDLKTILSQVKDVIVTESEKKKKSTGRLFGKRLSENSRGTGKLMGFNEFLKRNP